MTTRVPAKIWNRSDLSTTWTRVNPVLGKGEIGQERDTGKFKMGNGTSPWSELLYFTPEGEASSPVTQAQLDNHVEAPEPHPTYDEGTSFVLRYQNAKV